MKDRWNADQSVGNAWIRSEMRRTFDGATILVVEDDPDIRDLLSTLLEMTGYTTRACATAEEGLNALREETFDFVLTDTHCRIAPEDGCCNRLRLKGFSTQPRRSW